MNDVKTSAVRALCALMLLVALLPGCKSRVRNEATTAEASLIGSAMRQTFVMLTDSETSTTQTSTTQTSTTQTTIKQTTIKQTTARTTAATTSTKPPQTKPATTAAKTTIKATTSSVITTTSAPTTTTAAPKPATAAGNAVTYRTQINRELELVNEHRALNGRAPLQLDDKLTLAACIRAKEMADSGEVSHKRPNGTECFSVFDEVGISCPTAGENIAYGQSTPDEVFNSWRISSGHNRNMLDSDFQKIGIGVAVSSDGSLYWVQLFAKTVVPVTHSSEDVE